MMLLAHWGSSREVFSVLVVMCLCAVCVYVIAVMSPHLLDSGPAYLRSKFSYSARLQLVIVQYITLSEFIP